MSRERRLQQRGGAWRRGAAGIVFAVTGILAAGMVLHEPARRSIGTLLPIPDGVLTAGQVEGGGDAASGAARPLPADGNAGFAGNVPAARARSPFHPFAEPMSSVAPRLPNPEEAQQSRPLPPRHEFYFTRAAYSSGGGGFRRRRRQSWATDYPKSDYQFMIVAERLTGLDLFLEEHPRLLTDEQLNRFPFLYAVEVGYMSMGPGEVAALREFLLRGGFLVVDDFWGTYEWENFEYEMQKVFPELPIVDIPLEHEIFHSFYDIEEILQVPNVGNGIRGWATHERDGYTPFVKGIFDDDGRLMVIINGNTDLGDAWEWAEHPYYPLKYSTYAIQMGVNFIIYAMSH